MENKTDFINDVTIDIINMSNELFKSSKPIDANVAKALQLALDRSIRKTPTLEFLKELFN